MTSTIKAIPFFSGDPVPAFFALHTTSTGHKGIKNDKIPLGLVDPDAELKCLEVLKERMSDSLEVLNAHIAHLVERRANA